MSNDIVAVQMSTRFITFHRAQTGFFFRANKTVSSFSYLLSDTLRKIVFIFLFQEMVGPYNSEFYTISGLSLESRKRREHLSPEDLKKNKAIMETLTKGSSSSLAESNAEPIRRLSLPPPAKTNMSWNDYINSATFPQLGRTLVCKDVSKTFRATIAMVCF